MKYLSARIPDEQKNYVEDLAEALRRTDSWVVRELLNHAIKLHKEGKIEL